MSLRLPSAEKHPRFWKSKASLRGDPFKYILYHGVWDRNERYDLETDPEERVNLIDVPARRGDWQAAERQIP
jgi:N-acetylglucosamine-6-sulfatase